MNWNVYEYTQAEGVEEYFGLAGSGKSYEFNSFCSNRVYIDVSQSIKRKNILIALEGVFYVLLFIPRYLLSQKLGMILKKYAFIKSVYSSNFDGLKIEEGIAHFCLAYFYQKHNSFTLRKLHALYIKKFLTSCTLQPRIIVLGRNLTPLDLYRRRKSRGRGTDKDVLISEIAVGKRQESIAIADFEELFRFQIRYE